MATVDENRLRKLLQIWSALQRVPPLLWRSNRRRTIFLFAFQSAQSLTPVVQLWIAKLIVDRLVSSLQSAHSQQATRGILVLVALELVATVMGVLLREGSVFVRQTLAEEVTRYVSTNILAHAQELDLQTLERPEFYDHLRRAEESAAYRPAALLSHLSGLFGGTVTLAASGVILIELNPLALPLLLLASVPYALVQSRTAMHLYTLATGQTPEARQARYYSHLLSTDVGAKEIRVYGLSAYLLQCYQTILICHEQRLSRLAGRRALQSALAALLPASAYAIVLGYFALQALAGHITIGDLTLYTGLVLRSQEMLQQTMLSLANIVENGLFLDDYYTFLRLRSAAPAASGTRLSPTGGGDIRFEAVSYRYPGAQHDAVCNVSLELPVGETVAIVGENGAGKTTLIKLLTRLYEPDAGRITVSGHDVHDLELESWRRNIAVIFQDFIQYYLSARENIGFGHIDAVNDEGRIRQAACHSGASRTIENLPHGYDTVLGRWFETGMHLSGGEWQRIALARALMRNAPILILDEPTSALDARAEYELFQRLRELARGRTVLLISHRFSTVRMADRIYVLEGGRIVEGGTHEQLIADRGQYSELFHLQASSYR